MQVKNTFIAAAALTALSVAFAPSFAQTANRADVKAGAVAATHSASGPAGAGQGIQQPSTAKPMRPTSTESRADVKAGATAATHSSSGPAGAGQTMGGTQGTKPMNRTGSQESRSEVKSDATAAARQPGGPMGSGTAKKREQDRPTPASGAMKP